MPSSREARKYEGGKESSREARKYLVNERMNGHWSTSSWHPVTATAMDDSVHSEIASEPAIGPLRAQFGLQPPGIGESSPSAARQSHNKLKHDNTRVSFSVSVAAKNRAMLAAGSPKATQGSPSALLLATKASAPAPSGAPQGPKPAVSAAVTTQTPASSRRRATQSDAAQLQGALPAGHHRAPRRRATTVSKCDSYNLNQ